MTIEKVTEVVRTVQTKNGQMLVLRTETGAEVITFDLNIRAGDSVEVEKKTGKDGVERTIARALSKEPGAKPAAAPNDILATPRRYVRFDDLRIVFGNIFSERELDGVVLSGQYSLLFEATPEVVEKIPEEYKSIIRPPKDPSKGYAPVFKATVRTDHKEPIPVAENPEGIRELVDDSRLRGAHVFAELVFYPWAKMGRTGLSCAVNTDRATGKLKMIVTSIVEDEFAIEAKKKMGSNPLATSPHPASIAPPPGEVAYADVPTPARSDAQAAVAADVGDFDDFGMDEGDIPF